MVCFTISEDTSFASRRLALKLSLETRDSIRGVRTHEGEMRLCIVSKRYYSVRDKRQGVGGHGCYLRGSHVRRIVSVFQLRREALVESNHACLCTGVIRKTSYGHIRCHTSDRDYVAVVLLNHSRQELFHCQEMGQGVHFECFADATFRLVKDRGGIENSRIVD